MADMSAADYAAITRGNDMFGGESTFLWLILILFFFIGGNGWGNNGDVARESTMNTQFMERDLSNINTNVLENRYANQLAECETQKEVLLGNANLQKDILLGNQTLASQMASCCCDIKSLVRDEVQGVKDLINNNTIQGLRDQLNLAEMAAANATQTQNLLGTMGTWRANPSYAGCGCGCTNYTQI